MRAKAILNLLLISLTTSCSSTLPLYALEVDDGTVVARFRDDDGEILSELTAEEIVCKTAIIEDQTVRSCKWTLIMHSSLLEILRIKEECYDLLGSD